VFYNTIQDIQKIICCSNYKENSSSNKYTKKNHPMYESNTKKIITDESKVYNEIVEQMNFKQQ